MSTFASQDPTSTERGRQKALRLEFGPYRDIIRQSRCLDFGCGTGMTSEVLRDMGATEIDGVDILEDRVEKARETFGGRSVRFYHIPDTRDMPFADARFSLIVANATLEHIPQPRGAHIRELWRVLHRGGHLMVHETPNSWWPKDEHTTRLWFNQWLPERWAYKRALRRGRYSEDRNIPWSHSGWRGMSYPELVRPLPRGSYELIPETSRPRHRILSAIGLPASLFDPYPTWVLRKLR